MEDSSNNGDTWASTEDISAYFVLFSALLALVLVLSKFLHDSPRLAAILPEAGLILLVGMLAGCIVNLFVKDDQGPENDDDNSVAQSLLSFSPQVFFVALLPPIIFNSGYHLRRELFFRHITPIALFAVVGTTVAALTTTVFLEIIKGFNLTGDFYPTFTELLTFGALISATDPVSTLAVFQAKRVDPHLFYLVFGESVLNDAVGLVLFNSFQKFVERDNGAGKVVMGVGEFIIGFLADSVGSPALGLLCGCGAALLFKYVDMRNNRLIELSVYIMIMYVPFLLAEMIYLSGIVTILFTGMAARAYVVPNLSVATADNAETLFRLAAHLSETAIFLELGLSVFGLTGSFNVRFILWAIMACLIARAMNVYPITFLFNKSLREQPLDDDDFDDEEQLAPTPRKGVTKDYEMVGTKSSPTGSADSQDQGYEAPTPTTIQQDELTDSNHTMTPRQRRDLRISNKTATMLWYSGLRGAVAYACVRAFPDTFGHRNEFIMTTMTIVLVTVFVLGGTTELMLNFLKIETNVDENVYMTNWHRERKPASFFREFNSFVSVHVVREQPLTANGNGLQKVPSSIRDDSLAAPYHHHHDEMTESQQFDAMEGEIISPSRSSLRKKESLFDFGK